MSIIKHVTLQKIVARDFRYDIRKLRKQISAMFFLFFANLNSLLISSRYTAYSSVMTKYPWNVHTSNCAACSQHLNSFYNQTDIDKLKLTYLLHEAQSFSEADGTSASQ